MSWTFKNVAWGIVAVVVILLLIGSIGNSCGASWAGASNDTSARDKGQEVLDEVDDSTDVGDLAQTIHDKFDVSESKAKGIAKAVLAACKPNCTSLSDKLDGMSDKNVNDKTKVLAILKGATPATAPNPPQNTSAPTGSAPTAQAQAQQVSGNGTCKLQIVGPWSEINNAAPYRIEVGGGDVQHFDYYPTIGVQSISYIVPVLPRGGVAAKWYGYGQMWQGNGSECSSFDYVKDAVYYARGNASGQPGRLQQGHSGIVIDLRGGFKIVEKPAGWSEDQINALIALHKAAMNFTNPPTGGTVQATGTCSDKDGTRTDRAPVPNAAWEVGPTDSYRVVNLWSNQKNPNLGDHKLMLKPGESASLTGAGGAEWSWPKDCVDVAQKAYDANTNPPISLAQYQAYVSSGTMP